MGSLSADKIFAMQPLNEEDQKPNPVVQRVKMIMIAGLFMVHANRYLYHLLVRARLFRPLEFKVLIYNVHRALCDDKIITL